jgi:hypothetical protein
MLYTFNVGVHKSNIHYKYSVYDIHLCLKDTQIESQPGTSVITQVFMIFLSLCSHSNTRTLPSTPSAFGHLHTALSFQHYKKKLSDKVSLNNRLIQIIPTDVCL